MTAPAGVAIRPAESGDRDAIAALHAASWRAHYGGSLDPAYLAGPIDADRTAVWSRRLATVEPRQIVLLAETDDGLLAGFVCAYLGHDPVWGTLIDNLHVRADRKRAGLGRVLVGSMAEVLAGRDPGAPVHLFVLVANVSAQAFYDRIGGRVVEHASHATPDGTLNAVIRYAWDSPAALRSAACS